MTSAALHDPGGKVRTRLAPGMKGDAEFSPCGRYRPRLVRYWGDEPLKPGKLPLYALWIGLNPSTATAEVNDPTISREIAFTRDRLNLRCMVKCNVFDYRATSPKALAGGAARSPENIPTIVEAARGAHIIIAAWGNIPNPLRWGARDVVEALKGRSLYCLGLTKDGQPRHPLYVAHDAEFRRWK